MTVQLIKHDAARNALAEALRVDLVKSIRDKVVAMRESARQAKGAQLIEWAADIKAAGGAPRRAALEGNGGARG